MPLCLVYTTCSLSNICEFTISFDDHLNKNSLDSFEAQLLLFWKKDGIIVDRDMVVAKFSEVGLSRI